MSLSEQLSHFHSTTSSLTTVTAACSASTYARHSATPFFLVLGRAFRHFVTTPATTSAQILYYKEIMKFHSFKSHIPTHLHTGTHHPTHAKTPIVSTNNLTCWPLQRFRQNQLPHLDLSLERQHLRPWRILWFAKRIWRTLDSFRCPAVWRVSRALHTLVLSPSTPRDGQQSS